MNCGSYSRRMSLKNVGFLYFKIMNDELIQKFWWPGDLNVNMYLQILILYSSSNNNSDELVLFYYNFILE